MKEINEQEIIENLKLKLVVQDHIYKAIVNRLKDFVYFLEHDRLFVVIKNIRPNRIRRDMAFYGIEDRNIVSFGWLFRICLGLKKSKLDEYFQVDGCGMDMTLVMTQKIINLMMEIKMIDSGTASRLESKRAILL